MLTKKYDLSSLGVTEPVVVQMGWDEGANEYRVTVRGKVDGERTEETLGVLTLREAEREYQAVTAELDDLVKEAEVCTALDGLCKALDGLCKALGV